MVLYNVTVGIDLDIEKEWLKWMQDHHIPAVMKTEMFVENRIFKVLSHEQEETVSYSIQYYAENMEKVERYLGEFAPALVEEHRQRYHNRHVAFRTLLDEVV